MLINLFQLAYQQKGPWFMGISLINIVSLFLFIFFLHNMSRKIPLVGGLLLMSSTEASVLCFSQAHADPIFVFSLSCFFVLVFELSIGPIGWIQVHEILEPKIAALATACNWMANFVVAVITA